MKKVLVILSVILTVYTVQGQVNADSLRSVWEDETQADTNRLNAINELTFKHYLNGRTDLDSGIYFSQKMIDFAKERELKEYEASGIHNMALAHSYQGNPEQSLELNKQSLAIRREIGEQKEIGRSLANMGLVFYQQKNLIKALGHYKEALVNFEAVGHNALMAHAMNALAGIYDSMGKTEKSIHYMSRTLKVLEGADNPFFEIDALAGMATLYHNIGDNTKAKEYAELVLSKTIEIKYLSREIDARLILGSVLSKGEDLDEAISISKQILTIAIGPKFAASRSNAYSLMGLCYQKKEDYDKALIYYNKGIEEGEAALLPGMELMKAIETGEIYRLKKDGKKAVTWCEEALRLAEISKNIKLQIQACKCLYESYKILHNSDKALEYHEHLLALNDSLKTNEIGKMLQEIEFDQEMFQDSIAKADEARTVQEAHAEEVRQKNQTRNIMAIGGVLLLILAGGLYGRVRYIRKSKATLQVEKDRSENLLLNILPADIAAELKEKGKADARDFDMVSILFTDFKGFTEASAKLTAQDLVAEINTCFEAFDGIMAKYDVEKIKTIGDAYMAAGGLPVPTDDSTKNTVLAALEMQAFIGMRKAQMDAANKPAFEMRAGIHTGPVVAGIVGVKKFQYDIWGDTVNTAARMESAGIVGKVNISQATYELLKDDSDFIFESRGKIEAKGKGEIEMYFVSKA